MRIGAGEFYWTFLSAVEILSGGDHAARDRKPESHFGLFLGGCD